MARESFQLGDKDFKAQLTRIKPTAAPCLYISGSVQEVALIAKQCLEIGYKPKYLVGPDSWEDATIFKLAGKEMQQDFQSFYSTVLVNDDPDPDFQSWAKRFKAKYPDWESGAGALEALSYDAVKVAAWALAKAGKYNGEAMRQALMTLVNAPSASGIKGLVTSKTGLTFNNTRDAVTPVTIAQLKNNRFVFYTKILPTAETARPY
jgi:branched-chain amino acid transport system substrate-binding protein